MANTSAESLHNKGLRARLRGISLQIHSCRFGGSDAEKEANGRVKTHFGAKPFATHAASETRIGVKTISQQLVINLTVASELPKLPSRNKVNFTCI